jgi:hypothetical protein
MINMNMFLDFFTTIFKNYVFKVGLNKFQYSNQCEDENIDNILGFFFVCEDAKISKFFLFCV